MVIQAIAHGFPESQARASLSLHPGYKYGPERLPEIIPLQDGELLQIGDFQFRCVQTPGHTAGHICLHEPSKRILISGDHVLSDITPNIQCWSDREDPLGDFLDSLDKVLGLKIDLILPGHRRLIHEPRQRIEELKHHHRLRAEEVLSILKNGPKTAFQVAAEMTWDITCASWEKFPVSQKWFALGEAIAHLRHLEVQGAISRDLQDTSVVFFGKESIR
jgi:glyoxylase-like metal-dependent hydrolase (beta-lactamase superfamily II)